ARCDLALKRTGEAETGYRKVLAMPESHWPDRARAQLGIAECAETEDNRRTARDAYAKVLTMKNASRFDVAAAKLKIKEMK
ncbi:MAG: hypothetical protein GY851_01660, partial [bacterium]|nr:hypothetical protein [bacterium]